MLSLGSFVWAGCLGGSGDDSAGGDAPVDETAADTFRVTHSETSELVRITLDSLGGVDLLWSDVSIEVDDRAFRFGQFADFSDRRFQVDGKADDSSAVEVGDVISLPAVGSVRIEILSTDARLIEIEAHIPDNRAPIAPEPQDPAPEEAGVSRTPVFRWSASSDPSGVEYRLAYSPEPTLAVPELQQEVEGLLANTYSVPTGADLTPGLTYHWRVQAVDGAGNASPWSETFDFTVAG